MNNIKLSINTVNGTINPPEALEPTPENLANLATGNYVKIRVEANRHSEAFWCRVKTINNNSISVVVDQDLHYTEHHGLKDTDELEIKPKNVLSIMI